MRTFILDHPGFLSAPTLPPCSDLFHYTGCIVLRSTLMLTESPTRYLHSHLSLVSPTICDVVSDSSRRKRGMVFQNIWDILTPLSCTFSYPLLRLHSVLEFSENTGLLLVLMWNTVGRLSPDFFFFRLKSISLSLHWTCWLKIPDIVNINHMWVKILFVMI